MPKQRSWTEFRGQTPPGTIKMVEAFLMNNGKNWRHRTTIGIYASRSDIPESVTSMQGILYCDRYGCPSPLPGHVYLLASKRPMRVIGGRHIPAVGIRPEEVPLVPSVDTSNIEFQQVSPPTKASYSSFGSQWIVGRVMWKRMWMLSIVRDRDDVALVNTCLFHVYGHQKFMPFHLGAHPTEEAAREAARKALLEFEPWLRQAWFAKPIVTLLAPPDDAPSTKETP